MKFNNNQIYQMANNLFDNINDLDIYIPAKVNFFLQKNIQVITNAAQEIETARLEIAKHYGVQDEETQHYHIPSDKITEASQELNDLFNIEQDLEIKLISINDLDGLEFTPAQMQSIMFMIED